MRVHLFKRKAGKELSLPADVDTDAALASDIVDCASIVEVDEADDVVAAGYLTAMVALVVAALV